MTGAATGSPPRWAWLALVVILLCNVWLRAHTFGPMVRERTGLSLWPVSDTESEPLDCDEAAYGYIGKQIATGHVLYRDVTENKPPLGYWLYALAIATGGENELAIRLMPMPMVAATICLLWWIALRVSGPAAACLAALIYAVASTDPYVFGNGSNMEHAINLFSVASLALMVQTMRAEGKAGRWLVIAGACLGAACLVKQVAITHLAVYVLALLLRRGQPGAPGKATKAIAEVGALCLGFVLVWAVALCVLVSQGAGRDAYEDIIRYGGALVTDTPAEPHAPPLLVRWVTGNADPEGRLPWPFGTTDYLVWWGTGTWPLWLAAVPAIVWLLFGPSSAARRLLAAWTLSAWAQVALPRLFWPHYYMLPLPGVALVVALATTDAAERAIVRAGQPRRARTALARLSLLALIAALGGTAWIQVRDYLLVAPQQLTIRFKGGRQWVATRGLGRELAERTRGWPPPAPRLFVWGWQSPLLFYSELESPTRHFFADPLLQAYAARAHPLIAPRLAEIMSVLRARPPEIIFCGEKPFPELRAFLLESYRPVQLLPDARGLWVERSMYARYMAARPQAQPRLAR